MNAQSHKFEIQGHRGSRGLSPENTIPSFIRAIEEGVATIELDVVISKDKKVVVSHDPFFNSDITTDPSGKPVSRDNRGNLYQLKYAEIKKYDVGIRGNPGFPEQEKIKVHKPLLKQVISSIEKYTKSRGYLPVKYNIEIKSSPSEYLKSQPNVDEFSDLVYEIIHKSLPAERVNIQSFDFNVLIHWNLQISKKVYQKIDLAALIDTNGDNDLNSNLKKLGFQPEIWSPHFFSVNQEMVKELHFLNIKIIPWTVNDIEQMNRLKKIGCDGLITDYPNLAKNLN